jgi:NADPH-dependent glutamate synthase beta subunit-like oxidoreductase/NAD-dependent dihydropyrimidine dehydrogenase PreA subunit
VRDDATVLKAALENGIYIPNLCHHPDLNPTGACRLCIVEIDGMRGLPIACTTAVQDGMVVRTKTERLQQLRRNIVWLLVSECPVDKVDKNTQFKKVVDYIGINDLLPGFVGEPKKLPICEDDPLFVRDPNLCILCGRCYRACKEIRGVGAIGVVNRGIESRVTSSYDAAMRDTYCRFCGACAEVCPTGALRDKVSFTHEERVEKLVPCGTECPAHIDVATYVGLIAQKKYAEALAVIRETVPFPLTLGCVCPHPCESVCRRGGVNEAICIRELKRFVADHDDGAWRARLKKVPDTGKKVAIVGSGPAGLTAAYFLQLKGHEVTVYEAWEKPGGMMRGGIPKYRLPEATLDREIDIIKDLGVVIKTNTAVESIDALFAGGADAVFLAIGAVKGIKMGIPGEDDPLVLEGIEFLKAVNFGESVDVGKTVAVVGGGNVAIDVARVARRLGAQDVHMFYRRTRDEMPGEPEEIEGALEEGVNIQYLVTPVKVASEGGKLSVTLVRMEMGEPDAGGRRSSKPIPGSDFSMVVDRLIVSIGQQSDVPQAFAVERDKRGRIVADDNALQCSRKGVFAGGDVVTGPATVIKAIASGRKAAMAIDQYLGGDGYIRQRLYDRQRPDPRLGVLDGFGHLKRAKANALPVKDRFKPGFPEVEKTFDEKIAFQEANRCLRCLLRLTITQPPLPPDRS